MKTLSKLTFILWLLAPALGFCQPTNVIVGSSPNNEDGEPIRDAFRKINANLNWIYNNGAGGGISQNQFTSGLAAGTNLFNGQFGNITNTVGGIWFPSVGARIYQNFGGNFHLQIYPGSGGDTVISGQVAAGSFTTPSTVTAGSFIGDASPLTNMPSYSLHFYTNAITTNWIIGGIVFTNNGIQYVIPFGTNQ